MVLETNPKDAMPCHFWAIANIKEASSQQVQYVGARHQQDFVLFQGIDIAVPKSENGAVIFGQTLSEEDGSTCSTDNLIGSKVRSPA